MTEIHSANRAPVIGIGTRGSALALAQAELVSELLQQHCGIEGQLIPIETSGDRGSSEMDKSRFVKEIDQALLSGQIDLAIHSAKDIPAQMPDGIGIAAVFGGVAAGDAYLGKAGGLDQVPHHATIGTSSLRRQSQLLAGRPDLSVVPL
ncbi:MAG: hydroxymethylbilane synthase, partial [Dehalococcoidia bacterium]|nr:hydroxymethylbilane synthase [Dehalococcoidia bacterium]